MPDQFKHGAAGYSRRGCRCDTCVAGHVAQAPNRAYHAANRDIANARRREKRRLNPELSRERDRRSEAKLLAMTEFKHGVGGYSHHKCRCEVCVSANKAARASNYTKHGRTDAQKLKRKLAGRQDLVNLRSGPAPKEHGTWSSYTYGCRCTLCCTYRKRRKDKEKTSDACRSYKRRRLPKDPLFRLCRTVRARIAKALKGALRGTRKAAKTLELVGCSAADLKSRLEAMFLPGMSWSNYGSAWCVDHVKPCAGFDLADPEQQKLCFHYSNLQPLWNEVNADKSDLRDFDVDYELSQTPYPS